MRLPTMITCTPMTTTRVNKGHYYYGARYYDPKVSVWLSVDPLAAKYPSLTPYNFVRNNPISLVDPNGLSAWKPDGEGGFIAEEGDSEWSLYQQHLKGQGYTWEETKSLVRDNINNGYTSYDKSGVETTRINPGSRVWVNDVNKGSQSTAPMASPAGTPQFNFKAGEKYNLNVTNKVAFDAAIFNHSSITISYDGESIKSSGFGLGFGAGPTDAGIFTKFHSSEVEFFSDMSGNSLLEVFQQTGLITTRGGGSAILYNQMTGYDSPNTMNRLWQTNMIGHGLYIGLGGDRGVPNFKPIK